jgi:hypothetical protein
MDLAEKTLTKLEERELSPDDTGFAILLNNFFSMAPLAAAGTPHRERFIGYYNRVRMAVKKQSERWDMNTGAARNTIYRMLYGMRAAVEEVQLQVPGMDFDPAMFVENESSATPSVRIFGITVHSGDLLVSRGGAVVSALISRGNDYPGNFSHVALVCVDQKTGVPSLIESCCPSVNGPRSDAPSQGSDLYVP